MKFIYDDQGRLSEITFAENDNQEAICKMIENMQKNVCDTQKNYHDKYFEVQKIIPIHFEFFDILMYYLLKEVNQL